jgi:xanthine dehydrogenase small subunit
MRDKILLYINGERHQVGGSAAFAPVTDYLRYTLEQTGTKVVCAEGDCGACTVLLGRLKDGEIAYKPVNSCIQYLYQLDCSHIVTIEGLREKTDLNPVQEAMVACHGAQCGYCTPGMVVTMCALFEEKQGNGDVTPATEKDIRNALTGNLCRCTGYESILKAGMAVETAKVARLPKLYPPQEMIEDFTRHQRQALRLEADGRVFYNPVTLEEAVGFKKNHPNATIISGGTDVSVFCNKRDFEPPVVMGLSNLPGLESITVEGGRLIVGARASLADLERFVPDIFPELHAMLEVFGSPQIKHAGTLAGNIANGSPIGDTLPFLFVMEALVEVIGTAGTRTININELYTGYKTLALLPDELITRILIPLPEPREELKLYKVSRRKHLDISTFMAAIRMRRQGENIERIRLAYGGVGPVILRLPRTEAFLTGKPFTEGTFEAAGQLAKEEITPISDVRGSRDFRMQLAENILMKFCLENVL